MRARLCRRHFDHPPAFCLVFASEPPSSSRLLEQARAWLHGARWRPPQGACSATGSPTRHLSLRLAFASEPPSSSRLLEQARGWLHGARRRPPQGACSSLQPALRPGTFILFGVCIGAAIKLPTARASSRLAPRCEVEAASRCLLCHRQSDEAPFITFGVCIGAAIKLPTARASLRLAPRCEAEAASRCLFVSAAGTPTTHLQMFVSCIGAAIKLPTARASLRLAPRCEAEAASRCLLVSDTGTPTRHLQVMVINVCIGAAIKLPTARASLRLAPRCEAEAVSRCLLVSAAGTPTRPFALSLVFASELPSSSNWASKLAAGSTVRGGGRLKVLARLCRQGACSSLQPALRPGTLHYAWCLHRSRHQACGWSSELAAGSTVRGGGRLTVLARPCRHHSDQAFCIMFGVCIGARRRPSQGACLSPTTHLHYVWCLHRSRYQAPDCSSKLAASATVRGGGCFKVLAHPCRRHSDEAPTVVWCVFCIGVAMKLPTARASLRLAPRTTVRGGH